MSTEVTAGSIVQVRDEEWLVSSVEQTDDGPLLTVRGLSDLVHGTTAKFYDNKDLDEITPLDPHDATPVADASPHYRDARLWLEATLRKTPIPLTEPTLAASQFALAKRLQYQYSAVQQALDPKNLQPRILLADAVGLGKTIEIGMILSELIRRGRGERILIVCPRHVLEQMQNEMWSRFAIPLVRLDSVGLQRVKQKIPANRNPFSWYKRVIISMDTLKQDRFTHDLHRHHWDAVVIDESHNVTGDTTQNNRLAHTLAPNTDALILASATPHNGDRKSFAELISLLEPTAVSPQGDLDPDDLKRLVKRRHRNDPEVSSIAGADWAERKPPQNYLVTATPAEDAVADELDRVWLHPTGASPYSGAASTLFPWILAKAFLSSPAALQKTIDERRRRIATNPTKDQQQEIEALDRLTALNAAAFTSSAKYDKLVEYLTTIGIARRSPERAVVFAERVATLSWLRDRLGSDLKLAGDQITVLHGGLSDTEQQQIVESFKQSNSPIRVLVTGDVASEGVNLHQQCHELVHFDIPWSLIRIEQRNGRIDRYGQRHRPQITTLLLEPSSTAFRGDLRVLSRLLEREQEAHEALGDAASLMGHYSVSAEEEDIKQVLAGRRNFDDAVRNVEDLSPEDSLAALLASLNAPDDDQSPSAEFTVSSPLYPRPVDFLREALESYYLTPSAPPHDTGHGGGVSWRDHDDGIVEFIPPADLRQRLEVLPQSYLHDRHVLERFTLATDEKIAQDQLVRALTDDSDSSWPEAHYLSPLHPVLDWAADRALSKLPRNAVYVIRGTVDNPTVLVVGTVTDRRGLMVAASWMSIAFPDPANPDFSLVTQHGSSAEMLAEVGINADMSNPGRVAQPESLKPLVEHAVSTAEAPLESLFQAARHHTQKRIKEWNHKTLAWQKDSQALITNHALHVQRTSIEEEERLIATIEPQQKLARPLLVIMPQDFPIACDPNTSEERTHANQ